MCQSCFIEAGSPNVINERTRRVPELAKAIYSAPGGDVGAYAHIVVEDWNLEDENIAYCLQCSKEGGREGCDGLTQKVCIEYLEFMLSLTIEERYSGMALYEGIIKDDGITQTTS